MRTSTHLLRTISAAALLCGTAMHAAADGPTLYGVVDAGLSYASNINGSSRSLMDTGMMTPNLWGIRGQEDLGGGLKAVYTLEGQFALDTGAVIGSGVFGRQTWVGLSGNYGTLSLGKHYDFMFDSLAVNHYGPSFKYVSLHNLKQGPFAALGNPEFGGISLDFDRVGGASRLGNSIKFTSTTLNGFSVGALYAPDEHDVVFGKASSAGLNYSSPSGAVSVAYTDVKYRAFNDGADGIRNWGVGGHYVLGQLVLNGSFTNTKNTMTSGAVDAYQAGVTYKLAPAVTLLGDITYMKGNSQLQNHKATQYSFTADYELTKRTDAYVNLVYQKASGSAAAQAWIPGLPGSSSSDSQTLIRLGLRHFF